MSARPVVQVARWLSVVLAVSWGLVVVGLGALVLRLVWEMGSSDDGEAQFAGAILLVVWGGAAVASFFPAALSTAAAVSLWKRRAAARAMIGAGGAVTILGVVVSAAAPRWIAPEVPLLVAGQVGLGVLGVSLLLLSRSRELAAPARG